MKRPNSTVLLWLANALGWIGLGIAAFHQFGALAWRPAGALPEVRPLSPRPMQPPQAAPEVGAHNPFDPGAGRWIAAAPQGASATGDLRGMVVLPGVRAAVTGGGAVHVGELLAGGRLVGIRGGKVLVQRENAVHEIEVPAFSSPTLQSLTGAPPMLPSQPEGASLIKQPGPAKATR